MSLTIYHNPKCSKSRKTLQIIQGAGITPAIVTYLSEPPSAERVQQLATLLGIPVRDLARQNESEFKDSGDLPDLGNDAALAAWVSRHPKTLQRPIVVDDARGKAIIGRPPENVSELLP